MLKITDAQVLAFIADEQSFVTWYVDTFMPRELPEEHALMPRSRLLRMVATGRRRALAHGFDDPRSQMHVVTLMWLVGPDILTKPGFREIAEDRATPAPIRVDRLYAVPRDLAVDAIQSADYQAWFFPLGDEA